ncbi:F-actin-monooxygenase Mical isoform X1 [Anopheles funestus]|uniref:F-actin-monooxygenase Mical isoform X1 n=1 Tax=Anopheles funestus TaxID=62324 RepID=UPI0020C6CC3A|nr:F-actin-monooxygenase Mical isoform X1 [Anopheles funestus]XP_049288442.1 F-actin-monooxygenase Mical isoform X1 [Anopheles funestus]XP_049288450.1 F-actin-monooxygenase Mical isoform X1 [Anopheles funestus]XP_049288458.1 F-actin-monooxygenase Mical isoform X1 [Anopheles funestus]
MSEEFIVDHERAAMATEMFLHFCAATTMKQIRGLYWNMLDTIGLRPGPLNEFYPKLKATIRDWRAQALFKKFDARAAQNVYSKGKAASNTRVLIVGAGPCGLRTAIDAQLLGAKVVVVEKRDRISRNNVLHLWPFIIHDLKALGAKKFYGKFCAGSIDHISIRQLQCILLKVALLLGVEMHEGVSFVKEIEPGDGYGWRASVSPEDHAVSHYEFDVLIGADGKRNTLEGFQRKEFRGKLAIAITANFINKRTEAEAMVEEISGVAFIFDQPFFKALYEKTGCDLENIVYYKDDTHYFVMTAKKHSLLHRGVIIKDLSDPAELLAPSNVDKPKLYEYARDAANFATKYQMPNLEFAVNHYGTPDVAVFDFTSIFAAHNSCKVTVRKNYRLLSCLVGDSLLEPFWPTGSGCARGFLSSMDAAYAIKLFANQKNSLLATIAQRESVYRLLGQTTPENLNRTFGTYTLDPSTRYQNLNKSSVQIAQVKHLLDTDDLTLLEQTFFDSNAIASSVTPATELPVKRKRRTVDVVPLGATLLRWLKSQLKDSGFVQELNEPAECFTNGKVLCTLIHRYRPDLVNLEELTDFSADVCNEHAFNIFENQLGIPRVMSGQESVTLAGVDAKVWLNYLEQICDVFRGEIPHVKHIKLDYAEFKQKQESNADAWAKLGRMAAVQRMAAIASGVRPPAGDHGPKDTVPVATSSAAFGTRGNAKNYYHPNAEEERYKRGHVASPQNDTMRRMRKRRSNEKSGNIEERTRRLQEIEANRLDRQSKRREQRAQQTHNFYKSIHMLQANTFLRESDNAGAFEDYSLYMYRQSAPEFNDRVRELELKLRYPDRDRGLAAAYPRGLTDGDQFSDRVRSMEQRIDGKALPVVEKKPKDLLRAIGKIDSSDWNVKEIERKIEQSKKTTDIGKSRERVPNWNREQFLARQNRLMQPQDDEKYKEIDSSLKAIDKQLKEGHNLDLGERGKNKVALIAGQLQTSKQAKQQKQQEQQSAQQAQKSNQKALVLTASGVAEKCHFCKQRVYLMEKISAEGLTLHRSCLKCHHCHTILRLGSYAFDRDDPEGRFYCTQHFKLPAKTLKPASRKSQAKSRVSGPIIGRVYDASDAGVRVGTIGTIAATPEQGSSTVDYLARNRTPDNDDSDGEPNMEVIDENEWTDRNFGTESELSEAELSSSDESDTDSESDYEETAGSPLGAQTLQLASEWISDKRFSNMVDSDADFYSYSSEDDDADSQTEGEELARAREMRRQEVKLMPPPTLPTDTETEVATVQKVSESNISEPSGVVVASASTAHRAPEETAEDRAIKERMLKKLSVREQWLHAQSSSPDHGESKLAATESATTGGGGDAGKVKSTSFFGGLMNSLSTLIKPKSQNSPPASTPSPPPQKVSSLVSRSSSLSLPVSIQSTPECTVQAGSTPSTTTNTGTGHYHDAIPPSPKPSLKAEKIIPTTPGTTGKNPKTIPPSPTPSLKKHRKHTKADASPSRNSEREFERLVQDSTSQLSSSPHSQRSGSVLSTASRSSRHRATPTKDTRDDADEFLRQIKQEQLEAEKRSKKQEAKKFKSNMQSIRSAVDGGPKVVGVKSEADVAKFFAENQKAQATKKPKQLPNKDVTALQANSLARYFPGSSGAKTSTTGTPSSVSSVEGSPALGRKKPSEVDLLKYFGPAGGNGKSNASSTPPSSVVSPVISRKSSIESPSPIRKTSTTATLVPKPPVVPLPPKKNILAFQPIRKSKTEVTIQAAEPKKNVLALQPKAPQPKATPKPSGSPKLETKKKVSALSTSPKKSSCIDPDEQLFEDLLQDVNDELVDTFDAIVEESRSNKSSPKETRKNKTTTNVTRKESPKKTKKQNGASASTEVKPTSGTGQAVPKMTIKRPPFKITMPVKMQETLEEIYLASLSKLDTRSSSLIDLTNLTPSVETVEASGSNIAPTQLGKVLEEPEGDTRQRSSKSPPATGSFCASSQNGDSVELTLQPFQAPQQQQQQTTKAPHNRQAKDAKATPIPPAKTTRKENNNQPAIAAAKPTATTTLEAKSMNGPVEVTPAAKAKAGSQVSLAANQATPPSGGTPAVSRKAISSVQISLKQSAPAPVVPSEPNIKQRDSTLSTDPLKGAVTKLPVSMQTKQLQNESKHEPSHKSIASSSIAKKSEPTPPVAKSAFAPVSKDPLSQKSISMLELHRTPTVKKQEEKLDTSNALCNGFATPIAKRKQQPAVDRKANKTVTSRIPDQLSTPDVKHQKTEDKDLNKATNPQPEHTTPLPQETRELHKSVENVSNKNATDCKDVLPKTGPTPHTRSRTLSSDEQCFEELRKKHEAIFANQEIAQAPEVVKPPVEQDVASAATPKTLSDVRNSLIAAQPVASVTTTLELDERIDPHYREGINQLMMELMPGIALDTDVPIPKQRQKSSFHKELQKLQRANANIVCGPSAEPKLQTKPTENTDYKMEVIRTANTVKPAVSEKRQGSEEKMQIRLERSTQIKEQYAKAPSVLPSLVPSSAASNSAKKPTFVMPNVPSDIDKHRGILSRDRVPSKKQEIEDFEDLLEKIDDEAATAADIDLDELLADAEDVPKKNVVTAVLRETKNSDRNSTVSGVDKQGQVKMESKTYGASSKRVETSASKPVSNVTKNSGVNASTNRLSEAKLNETISQLTDKMNQSRISGKPTSPQKERTEAEPSKDVFTSLFNTTDASQTDLDMFEELCKKEDPEPKQNRSDLVDSSTIAHSTGSPNAAIMPDVISSTKKPSIDEPKALKILECIDTLKQGASVAMKVDTIVPSIVPLVVPPQEIQVYTLHTAGSASQEDEKDTQPQPSTQGMSGDYAHILKDITSGLVGADFAAPVVYEPPVREEPTPRKERHDFQAYKQLLEEKSSREEPVPLSSTTTVIEPQPQRPLRRQKKFDRTDTSSPVRAFDNSICIDPWRARKSASIENIAIEQVFVKQNDAVVDTFFVVPDTRQQSVQRSSKLRRSKSYDRLAVPMSGQRRGSMKQKQSLEELRDFGYDVEPSSRSRHLVDPRLRHIDLDLGSDEELASLRDHPARRWQTGTSKFRKNKSMTDVGAGPRSARGKDTRPVEPPKVDIDRESPRPRTTDFSKWEAILDRGVTYYEGGAKPKPDIKSLEKRIEDLDVRRARPLRRKAIPKDYDPDEYVPRINRRGADLYDYPDPTLPRDYDPEEYVPKPSRAHAVPSPPGQPLPRSYDPDEYIPKANRREQACYEVPVAIQRTPAKYYKDPYYAADEMPMHYPGPSVPLGRSKTASHVPTTSVAVPVTTTASRGGYEREPPARDITRSQYSRRYDAEDRHIVDRSHRLHEKTNKFIRTQLTRNDPNPYIREMIENDSDDDYHYPTASSGAGGYHHQRPGLSSTSSSMAYGTGSTYGSSGAAAMSRIQTKAITQPSRMLQYGARKEYPTTSTFGGVGSRSGANSYDHRRRGGGGGGDPSRTRDNCNIS